jgi:hypothetical protein
MFPCICMRSMRYCSSSSTGTLLPSTTRRHQGVNHHDTDHGLKTHANFPAFLQLFLASSRKRSPLISDNLPRILPAAGNCPSQRLSPSHSRLWQAGRATERTSNPGIFSERPGAVDCGQHPRIGAGRGTSSLALGSSSMHSALRPGIPQL